MKKILLSLMVLFLCGNASFAEIDQCLTCRVKYDATITYQRQPVAEVTHKRQEMEVVFYLDTAENKIYNADKVLMEGAIVTPDKIEISWDSVNNPRFCFLLDRGSRTVLYKAFFDLPPFRATQGDEVTMSIEHHGQGSFYVRRI